jgi:hypothetical protein
MFTSTFTGGAVTSTFVVGGAVALGTTTGSEVTSTFVVGGAVALGTTTGSAVTSTSVSGGGSVGSFSIPVVRALGAVSALAAPQPKASRLAAISEMVFMMSSTIPKIRVTAPRRISG